MKKFNKLSILLMICSLLFVFAGCENSAVDVMKTANEKLADVKSMEYDLSMDMEFVAGDSSTGKTETFAVLSKGTVQQLTDPVKLKMNMTMDMGLMGTQNITMYSVQEGENFTSYISADGKTWQKEILSSNDIVRYNAKDSLQLYLANIESFKENGTEEINGSVATRYDGVITGDSMEEVLNATGAMEQFSSMGIDEETAKKLYSGLGDLNVSIWIDNESSLPVKYDMDMTEFMQGMMDKMVNSMGTEAAGMTMAVNKMVMSMTITAVNNVESIDIPEAALK